MNTLKAERAMTTLDKLREFGQKVMREYGRWWGVEAKDADKFVSDLTALISEGYVTKEKYMDDLCDEYQRGFEDGMDEARNTDRL